MPKIKISKLSSSQRAKLLRGYGVRVKVGNDHEIEIPDIDLKRISSKSVKDVAHTLRLDNAYKALNKHLKGNGVMDVMGNIAKDMKPIVMELGKEVAKNEIKKHYGGSGLCEKCGGALLPAGVIENGGALLPAMGGSGTKKRRKLKLGAGIHEALLQVQAGLHKAGEPFKAITGVNPADLGADIGEEIGKSMDKRGRGTMNKRLLAYMKSNKNIQDPLKYFPTVL